MDLTRIVDESNLRKELKLHKNTAFRFCSILHKVNNSSYLIGIITIDECDDILLSGSVLGEGRQGGGEGEGREEAKRGLNF